MTNIVIETGRLTADPELKITGESKLCKFRIAVDRPKKKGAEKPETDFFNCTAWNHNAEFINDMFSKGEIITIVGNLRSSTYEKNGEKRSSVEIKVNEVHFPTNRRKPEGENNNGNADNNSGFYGLNRQRSAVLNLDRRKIKWASSLQYQIRKVESASPPRLTISELALH